MTSWPLHLYAPATACAGGQRAALQSQFFPSTFVRAQLRPGIHYVAQAGTELVVFLLPKSPLCCDLPIPLVW